MTDEAKRVAVVLGARNLGGAIAEHLMALARVRDELDPPQLIVNAVSASRPPDDGAGFRGGPLGEATLEGFRGWTAAVAEQCFVFLSTGIAALREGGSGGTLIQVTGGSSRRAMPSRGDAFTPAGDRWVP